MLHGAELQLTHNMQHIIVFSSTFCQATFAKNFINTQHTRMEREYESRVFCFSSQHTPINTVSALPLRPLL